MAQTPMRSLDRTPATALDAALRERLKEIDTLVRVSQACHAAQSLPELLDSVVGLAPLGWQFTDDAVSALELDGTRARSDGWVGTPWRQVEDLYVGGVLRGRFAVGYLREHPAADEGPFLAEERRLIGALAHEIEAAVERIEAEERLTFLANRDSETGRLNRRSLTRLILNRVAVEPERAFAYVVIDLTRFWELNRHLGLGAGNEIIKQVSDRLVARFGDTVGREARRFVMLVDDVPYEALRDFVRDEVIPLLDTPFEVAENPTPYGIGFSVAATHYPGQSRDPLTLASLADAAQARAGGFRELVIADPELDLPEGFAVDSVTAIRAAAAAGEFTLLYQPKIDRSGEVHSVEALIRWERGGRLVPPSEFLDVAERHGLVRDVLTPFVLFRAFNQASAWAIEGHPIRIAVNISPSSLQSPELLEIITQVLKLADIDPGLVEVEVTESAVMANLAHAKDVLDALRAMGITVALDDFGTGFSSLALLRQLEIDVVKIDRSFVARALESEADAVIVESTIAMARAVGAKTVAEGVEDQATAAWLWDRGIDTLQGYYISRPIPPDEVLGRQFPYR